MASADFSSEAMRWRRIDLHIHTPASQDYEDKNASYLDILREAERRGLDIIAFTDHNTIAGYETLFREIEFLERLETRGRLNEKEQTELDEYRRLLSKITVLPGFEVTTRFGAHVLGVFSPKIQHCIPKLKTILHQLGIPFEKMDLGTTSVPGTQAYLEIYKIINEMGGIVIAAHINSPTGVLAIASNMPTGAARVSATQSPYLHALEFAGFHSTQLQGFASPSWYDGSKLGYERRMHCLQGSDAHRLVQDANVQKRRWGIGDRPSEVLLAEPTFEELLALFQSQDFHRLRVPFAADVTRYNRIAGARATGTTNFQILCPDGLDDLKQMCCDVAALANSGGGVIYLGLNSDPDVPVKGVANASEEMRAFHAAISKTVFPSPDWAADILKYEGQDVVQIDVQEGQHKPYFAKEQDKKTIYVRRDSQTTPATHSDIIDILHTEEEDASSRALTPGNHGHKVGTLLCPGVERPGSGVEIVGETLRGDTEYFRVVDLRTGRESYTSEHTATLVWLYAIQAHQQIRHRLSDLLEQARWHGQIGLWRLYRENEIYDQRGRVKCDLAFRNDQGEVERVFYAVAVNHIDMGWEALFECEPPAGAAEDTEPSGHRIRWRGNMGVEAAYHTPAGLLYDLVFRNPHGRDLYYRGVPTADLAGQWLDLLAVELPRSGLEVVEIHDNGLHPYYKFHNLGNRQVESRQWTPEMLKEGSLRHYALRMYTDQDCLLDDSEISWIGNIGFLRRSYTTVDLVYRAPDGLDHIYYGARWDDLSGDWLELMAHY